MKTWIKLVVATALIGTTLQAMSAEGRAVTPEGMKALKNIGEALRDLDAYEVQMKVTTRVATDDGKYRDVVGNVHYIVRASEPSLCEVGGGRGRAAHLL